MTAAMFDIQCFMSYKTERTLFLCNKIVFITCICYYFIVYVVVFLFMILIHWFSARY